MELTVFFCQLRISGLLTYKFDLILTDNVVDDAVDIVPSEHFPSERELYGKKPFRLELYAFTPELDLVEYV